MTGLLRGLGLDINRTGARRPIVLAGAAALAAAGLNPIVFGPALPNLEIAARSRPELEGVFLLSILLTGSMFLVGGLLGDVFGRRRVLLAGLGALALANLATTFVDSPLPFVIARLAAAAAVGLVVPSAVAAVAVPFQREVRAVTLAIAFTSLGLGSIAAVVLVAAATPLFGYWPSLWVAIIATAVALRAVDRGIPPDESSEPFPVMQVGIHAVWAFGLLALTAAIIGLGGEADDPLRIGLGIAGGIALAISLPALRAAGSPDGAPRVDPRPAAFALVAGVVVAFAQSVPLLVLPKYLRYVEGFGAVWGVVAVAPLIVGFVLGGPLAAVLTTRYSPRLLITASLVAVGLANLALALLLPAFGYLLAIVPLLLIGLGFIVGTSIRTALIFASVTRRLPATAAAWNQTSILMGSQLGILVATSIVGRVALQQFRDTAEGLPATLLAARVDEFRQLLRAIDTAYFAPIVVEIPAAVLAEYAAAFSAGTSAGLLAAGVVAIVGAAVTWVGIPADDPVVRWAYREEQRAVPPDGPRPGSLA